MLNISPQSIRPYVDTTRYESFIKLEKRTVSKVLIRLLITVGILGIAAMFLPWTQNIRSSGVVTTLNPYDRPQAIQSLIDGRIVQWHVREGMLVQAGDTIIQITESKEDYLDPEISMRTQNQIQAKNQSADAYRGKADNLEAQYQAILQNRSVKLNQNQIKIQQTQFKIRTDSMALVASNIKLANAKKQYDRTEALYDDGIKSLTELENKRFAFQEAEATVTLYENKLQALKNELENLEINREAIINDFDNKLFKIQSDRMSALSNQYSAEGEMNKLQSQLNKISVRSQNYYITSPIDGYITKSFQTGIGEFIKAGEDLVSIIPYEFDMAVEVYVKPRDVPLLSKGQEVRMQFDGWPAIVFSGWPNNSFGTYSGKIFAIDNYITESKGGYRVLVAPDPDEEPWPKEVRIGGGTNALFLLKNVKLYYELWRQLNGFPPDYYQGEESKEPKLKAPIRSLK